MSYQKYFTKCTLETVFYQIMTFTCFINWISDKISFDKKKFCLTQTVKMSFKNIKNIFFF